MLISQYFSLSCRYFVAHFSNAITQLHEQKNKQWKSKWAQNPFTPLQQSQLNFVIKIFISTFECEVSADGLCSFKAHIN